jgi:hypothetical protein
MRRYPTPTCPIGGVVWSEAAAYCNWLSKQEGIAVDQWCYETDQQGRVTKFPFYPPHRFPKTTPNKSEPP